MAKQSKLRLSLRTKTSTKKYLVPAISVSFVITLFSVGFLYFKDSNKLIASSTYFSGTKNQLVLEKQKNNRHYIKDKQKFDFRKDVYHCGGLASERPGILKRETNEEGKTVNKANSPAKKSIKYPWLVELSSEEKNKAIKILTPSSVLPVISFVPNNDEYESANRNVIKDAIQHAKQGKLLLIEAHSNDAASSSYNSDLSIKRGEKIKNQLLKAGADPDLIFLVAHGEDKPILENTGDTNRDKTSKVEIKVFDF